MPDQKKSLSFQMILLSLSGFVLLWAVVTDAWGYSAHLTISHGGYVYAYISRLVWAAPALWLIKRYGTCVRFSGKALFSRPVCNKSLLVALGASLIVALGEMLAAHGGFWLNPSVNLPLEIIKFIMVGLVEETVFRGWGYNALSETVSDGKAVVCSTAFFVLLHWPAYFIRLGRFGTMDYQAWLSQCLAAAIWGVVCCRLLKKEKTLWNPIIAHTVYDILIVLLVG